MKSKILLFGFVVCLFLRGFAQTGVAINNTGAEPDNSAMLDVSSTEKGMLIPRMTETERDAIASPAEGLMVFQTDGVTGFYYYQGSWKFIGTGLDYSLLSNKPGNATISTAGLMSAADKTKLDGYSAVHSIGESYGGGIIFWLDASGQHGLIAATTDQSSGAAWTSAGFQSTKSNAVMDGVNGGFANTERIIIQAGEGSYAAQLCANYRGGNYADWYLPSKYELDLLYLQKSLPGLGGLAQAFYWSSTEYSSNDAWGQYIGSGLPFDFSKYTTAYVRAIRAF